MSRINTADSNQYFLLENRQFTGYDKGFEKDTGASGHGGLVIYHIDKLKTPPQYWYVNADENDKGVDVERPMKEVWDTVCWILILLGLIRICSFFRK